jgi:chemotaxis methyl-accepting protein methylase
MTSPDAMEAAVDRVAEWLDDQIGLRPEPTLRGRLRRSIRDEVVEPDGDLDEYLHTLARGSKALQGLINRVTVQESGFFRHPDHFEVLAGHVLPDLSGPVAIWSAGCANGQEAYSLAMLLEENETSGSILATDVSTAALSRTAAARYTPREILGISPYRRSRHVTREGDAWRMNSSVRARVTTTRHNLTSELPGQVAGCQVVFCRNVLIYLSAAHATSFLDRLADLLAPGAYLFLGAAESLWHTTDRFHAVRMGDSFVFRRAEKVSLLPAGPAIRPWPASPIVPRWVGAPTVASHSRGSGGPVSTLSTSVQPLSSTGSQPAVLAAAGRKSLGEGDHAAAVVAFRKWAYLAPEDPLAPLHLGLALEAAGDAASAVRAFRTSRAIVERHGSGSAESELKGYAVEELLRLLDIKHGQRR